MAIDAGVASDEPGLVRLARQDLGVLALASGDIDAAEEVAAQLDDCADGYDRFATLQLIVNIGLIRRSAPPTHSCTARRRALLPLGTCEVRREVLCVGEEADDVDATGSDEIEPAAREPGHASIAQPRNVAELADPRRSGTWHAADRLKGCDRRVEEPGAEFVTALAAVVPRPFDHCAESARPGSCSRLDGARYRAPASAPFKCSAAVKPMPLLL